MKEEYWSSLLTEKSWKILQDLKRNYKFILIGGWAVYLLTKQKKSKDIDIIITLHELEKFKQQNISKNNELKKYELKKEEIDIDIYLDYFSKLTIPVEEIKNYILNTEGFTIAKPELLLILKQGAYKDRQNSVKGEKDLIDIISLLFFSSPDFNEYYKLLKKYALTDLLNDLKLLLKNFKDFDALNLTPREFKLKKGKLLIALSKLR